MECTFNLSELKQIVSFLQKAIPNKPQLPILSSILIEVDNNQATFSATDLFLGVQATLNAKVASSGKLVVPGDIFKQIIQSLSGQQEVVFQLLDDQLQIICGENISKLTIQASDDYPDFPEVIGQQTKFKTSVLQKIEQKVGFCASLDQSRPILTTILLEFKENNLRAVATDGFRLSVLDQNAIEQAKSQEDEQKKIMISAKAFCEIVNIAEQLDQEEIEITTSEELKQIYCQLANIKIYIRLIEGEYPPYEKIIPPDFAFSTQINLEELNTQLKRASLFSKEASNIVKLSFSQNSLQIKAVSSALGSYKGEIVINNSDEAEREIAFNVYYLLDLIQAVKNEDNLIFKMNESLKPALFCIEGEPNWQHIVMPFRVNS